MKKLKICSAVSAALMASSGAFALSPADTAAAPTQLVVASIPLFRDSFQDQFSLLCQAGTVNLYRASPAANQDFRAYSCTLLNAAPVPIALRNTNVSLYYRSEGNAAWGPGSIAKGTPIMRLLVDGACSFAAPPALGDCSVSGYTLSTDTGTGHIVKATTDLAISDQEARMYRGENWVGGALSTEPAVGALEALSRSTGIGQTFGVLVNAALPVTSLTRADIADIYSGNFFDWSDVGLSPQPITVCRREPGSGTQTAAAIHFLGQICRSPSDPFVVAPTGPNGNPVIENGTTTAFETCVAANPGAIGPSIFKSPAPAGTKYLEINAVAPSKANALSFLYDYSFESSFAKRPGLTGNQSALANLLIDRTRAVAGIPGTSASSFGIPGLSGNVPGPNVALHTRGGDNCRYR